ncbi:MAG TPA: hypothetical protein V6D30_05725 [Leptolyngbyaceae cyanobacterium]
MTAIAIWFNDENPKNPSLWIASDSRVSKNQSSTLIDNAAKVFTLPVVCRFPGEEGFFSKIAYYHTYGYCFAGSTLLGQNTFLALMPLLSNLVAVQPYTPQMADVAQFVLEYLGRAFDDYKVIASGRPLSRIPRYIIEEHIQDSAYKTIGGDLQLGRADQLGFQPFSICKPRVTGQPEAYLSYLGYELHEDIKNVGDASIGLPGMI